MDEEIVYNIIYKSIITTDDIYAYIRAWKENEIGFSVLDYVSPRPDFSQCGVFWMAPKDFLRGFKPYICDDENEALDFDYETSGRHGGSSECLS